MAEVQQNWFVVQLSIREMGDARGKSKAITVGGSIVNVMRSCSMSARCGVSDTFEAVVPVHDILVSFRPSMATLNNIQNLPITNRPRIAHNQLAWKFWDENQAC